MKFKKEIITKDLIVVGGGIPGICAAIQAARLGITVALVNNRGYLGGNASAEVRVNINGADGSQEFNLNARVGGILNEIIIENLHRNPEGNSFIFDALLNEFVGNEPNIEVFLNTNVDEVNVDDNHTSIVNVIGSQQNSEKCFAFCGRCYVDNTGDGTVGYLAGAEFRAGREAKAEFDERIAPEKADECVLPSTVTYRAKDMGKPIAYQRPAFALDLTKTDILSYREIPEKGFMYSAWYYEVGGSLNQITDNEKIMEIHRSLVYGIWDYIKNSGKYASQNYDLEYVAPIPGKRESRRLVGDYLLTEKDIVNQKDFEDTVGFGGWSIDLHAVDGFFSKEIVNKHIFLNGIYQIPYRTGYSKNINNLFMAGRCMSTTHVAFGSTRVMGTLATLGQAVGAAAFLCKKYDTTPRGIYESHIKELQQILLQYDQFIVGVKMQNDKNLMQRAKISASSVRKLTIAATELSSTIAEDMGISLPPLHKARQLHLFAKSSVKTSLQYEVYLSNKPESYSPFMKVGEMTVAIEPSSLFNKINLPIDVDNGELNVFIKLLKNEQIELALSEEVLPGVVSYAAKKNNAANIVSIETLEPKVFNWKKTTAQICFDITPQQNIYNPENITNGYSRSYGGTNLWLSDTNDESCFIEAEFEAPQSISELVLLFNASFNERIDCFRQYSANTIPEIVRDYDVYYEIGGEYRLLKSVEGNYKRENKISFAPIVTSKIKINFKQTNGSSSVGLAELRAY